MPRLWWSRWVVIRKIMFVVGKFLESHFDRRRRIAGKLLETFMTKSTDNRRHVVGNVLEIRWKLIQHTETRNA